jgi:hypothetical protein
MYVIKHKAADRYLTASDKWTDDIAQARRFPNGLSLVLHLEQHQLGNIEEDLEILSVPTNDLPAA